DGDIAGEHDLESAAEGKTVDRGDNRGLDRLTHHAEKAPFRVIRMQRRLASGHVGQIGPRAEGPLPRPGDHHRTHGPVGLGGMQRVAGLPADNAYCVLSRFIIFLESLLKRIRQVTTSALAISDEHVELAEAALGQLRRCKALAAARGTADGASAHPAEVWDAAAGLGWHGLAVDERYGGSGFGLAELAIVLEVMGHELCPGPFLPTVTLAAALNMFGSETLRSNYLPALATGAAVGAVATCDGMRVDTDGTATGRCPAVLGAPDADVFAIIAGDDVLVVDALTDGLAVTGAPASLDTTRHIGDLALTGVRTEDERVIRNGARRLRTIYRILVAAEALGSARATLEMACEYAKVREQFGRTIGTFQAVKHHLANML